MGRGPTLLPSPPTEQNTRPVRGRSWCLAGGFASYHAAGCEEKYHQKQRTKETIGLHECERRVSQKPGKGYEIGNQYPGSGERGCCEQSIALARYHEESVKRDQIQRKQDAIMVLPGYR